MDSLVRSGLQHVQHVLKRPAVSVASVMHVLGEEADPTWSPAPISSPSAFPGDGSPRPDDDESLSVLLPLLLLLILLLFLLLVFLIFLVFLRRTRITLRDDGGPTNLEREDDIDGDGGLAGVEQRWLESAEETTRAGYLRAKGASMPPLRAANEWRGRGAC